MQSGSSRTVPKTEANLGQPLKKLQQQAKSVLAKEVYNYIAGTSDDKDEPCINNQAFQGYRIVPRMLQNVYKLDNIKRHIQ